MVDLTIASATLVAWLMSRSTGSVNAPHIAVDGAATAQEDPDVPPRRGPNAGRTTEHHLQRQKEEELRLLFTLKASSFQEVIQNLMTEPHA